MQQDCVDFKKGDPYTKVEQGFARLPGDGYTALHPELEGIDPEDYSDVAKMRILADVAPYSREYQKFSQIVRRQSNDDPELRAEYERIADQVRQTKASTLQIAKRHFNAPIDEVEGTVKRASTKGVELAEYPGRVFHFSSVGTSMADLTAEMLGSSNKMTRAAAAREADMKRQERDRYLAMGLGPSPPRIQNISRAGGTGPALCCSEQALLSGRRPSSHLRCLQATALHTGRSWFRGMATPHISLCCLCAVHCCAGSL